MFRLNGYKPTTTIIAALHNKCASSFRKCTGSVYKQCQTCRGVEKGSNYPYHNTTSFNGPCLRCVALHIAEEQTITAANNTYGSGRHL